MKNTLALGLIILGALMVYSGFKNWTLVEALKFFTGQDDGGVSTPAVETPQPTQGEADPDRTPRAHEEAAPR